ncbi:hypothetical protein PPTG_22907 [Phytophthora nicotianae INRA-310]|uniref:Uncharacterized protein n=1 Tax=Phytophthora nicotianae (strain INRA-310) TaxID=761204 RepID=W2Q714_PHYN3|nr:hypothetical protein PPTG_22907 [Phytophthora nicotianae INRA-310]ETN08983.1 hypothetical protein PPTG_22907 [Phytophthora nicotianae INRA-310]
MYHRRLELSEAPTRSSRRSYCSVWTILEHVDMRGHLVKHAVGHHRGNSSGSVIPSATRNFLACFRDGHCALLILIGVPSWTWPTHAGVLVLCTTRPQTIKILKCCPWTVKLCKIRTQKVSQSTLPTTTTKS